MEGDKFIQGEDIVITVNDKITLHATTHTLNVSVEMKDVRTKNTNGKEKSPGDVSWEASGDGLVAVDPAVEESDNVDGILKLALDKTLVDVVVKSPIQGALKTYSGKGYFTNITLTTPAGDNSTYSYTLTGSGNLTPSEQSLEP